MSDNKLTPEELEELVEDWFYQALGQDPKKYREELLAAERLAEEFGVIEVPVLSEYERLRFVLARERVQLTDSEISTRRLEAPRCTEKRTLPIGSKIFKYIADEKGSYFTDEVAAKTEETKIVISKHVEDFVNAFTEVRTCFSRHGENAINFIINLLEPRFRAVIGYGEDGEIISRCLLYVDEIEKEFSIFKQYSAHRSNYSLFAAVHIYFSNLGYKEVGCEFRPSEAGYAEESESTAYLRNSSCIWLNASDLNTFDSFPRCPGCGEIKARGIVCCYDQCAECGEFLDENNRMYSEAENRYLCTDCGGFCKECDEVMPRSQLMGGCCAWCRSGSQHENNEELY